MKYHLICVFIFLFVSLCSSLSIYPSSVTVQQGSVSDQDISVLKTNVLTGTTDNWNEYKEFDGTSKAFKGTFTFDVSSVNVASVTGFRLNVNIRGPIKSYQTWQFEWYNTVTSTYILAGDNAAVASWVWKYLSFSGSGSFSNYVSNGKFTIRYSSLTAKDNSDLDFVELSISTSSSSTGSPTSAPTTAPTSAPTSAPTAKPTSAPTSAPTAKPTSAPTSAPTSSPTSAPGGRKCPAGKIWSPSPSTTFHIQYSGTMDYSRNVQAYNIDMFDAATTSVVSNLHSRGVAVICYFSSQYENWRPDSQKFVDAGVLGSALDGWPGENWVDIRKPALRAILTARMDTAVSKGCDAIDVDNVDGYSNSNGLGLTAADQLDFNIYLANQAHARGLAIALKNDLAQISSLVSYFDFAVNEQCNAYGECSYLDKFVQNGKAVFGIEYDLTASSFCSATNTKQFTFTKKNLALDAPATDCCTLSSSGCTNAAPYTCK